VSQRLAERLDLSLPANQRKLEAAEALAQLAEEAGLSLIELAIAFAFNYPAVTAAIIGPRTMEQLESQLPAAEVVLDALLDRIDQIRAATTLACAEHAGPVVGASLRVVAARLSDHQ
jgi:aryl-alcohol dehydrogenase-like predicted oxidoreductase